VGERAQQALREGTRLCENRHSRLRENRHSRLLRTGIAGRENGCSTLVSRRETRSYAAWLGVYRAQLLRDVGDLVVRGDPARQREMVQSHGARRTMGATATPSVRLERTDAHVGL